MNRKSGELEEVKERDVAVYCRVSTKEQAAEGYSLDAQEEVCIQAYLDMGIERTRIRIYRDEGTSGKNIKGRPQMQALIEDAKKGKIGIVYVWKLTRLSRKLEDTVTIVNIMIDNDVEVKTIEQKIDLSTASGRLTLNIMASIAEFERETIVENVKLGMNKRAKDGKWNGGRILGYDSIEENDVTKLVVNDAEANTVRRIYAMYLDGKGYRTIANILNIQGERTKSKKNSVGKLFSGYAIKYILTNSVYIGKVSFNKREGGKVVEKVEYEGEHKPIIDEKMWSAVQKTIKQKESKPSRTSNGTALLTGLMRCPFCGATMVKGTSCYKRKDGTKTVYRFYKCSQKTIRGTSACEMKHIVKGTQVEVQVINKIKVLAGSNKLLDDIIDRINETNRMNVEPLKKEKAQLQRQINEVKKKKERIVEAYVEGVIKKEDISDMIEKTVNEIKYKEKRLKEIEIELMGQGIGEEVDASKVKELLKKLFDRFDDIDSNSRKTIMQILIQQIYLKADGTIDKIQLKFDKDMLKELGVSIDTPNLFVLEI